MQVQRKIEFDMGHRVPNHKSKCSNPHGHRYVCFLTMEGDLVQEKNDTSEGMVIDFSDIKTIANTFIDETLDHGFMYFADDFVMKEFFDQNPQLKAIKVDFIPTAEEIAYWLFNQLEPQFLDTYGTGLKLKSIELFETPNCSATYQKS